MRRARAGLSLLLTIVALVIATTATIAGTVGYAAAAATTAARQAITEAELPTEAGLRVQTRQAEDPAAQDVAARRLIAEAFAPAPVDVTRALASEPRPVTGQDGRLQLLAAGSLLADDPSLTDRVEVVEGSWPVEAQPVQGALHTGAARRWDVVVGDVVIIGGVDVQVSALWRPIDPTDPSWFGDPLMASGGTEDLVGPLVVTPSDIVDFGDTPFVRWTVQPDPDELEPDDLTVLSAAAARLDVTLDTPEVAFRGVTVEGDLAPTAQSAARNLATARALNVVPLALLLGVSVIAVLQVARLLAAARTSQIEVLIGRGASRRQVIAWSSLEALVVTAVGTVTGSALAAGLLQLVPAGAAQASGVLAIGLLTGAAVLLGLVALTVLQVRTVAARRTADRSGRARAAAALGTVTLTLAAAGLSWWQLRRYGSPLVAREDGTLETDLLAGLAPTLMLVAVAVVAVALLGPVTRAVEVLTRPGTRLVAHLCAAQVSRRLVTYAVPVILVVLAVGATTLAGMYSATSADLRSRLSALGQGADVRATLEDRPVAGEAGQVAGLPDLAGVPGVEATSPVWLSEAGIGTADVLATVAPLAAWADVAIVPTGGTNPADLTPQLAPGGATDAAGSVAIPTGTTQVQVPVELQVRYTDTTLEQALDNLPLTAEFLVEQGLPEDQAEAEAFRTLVDQARLEGEATVRVLVRDPASGVVQSVRAGSVPADLEVTSASGEVAGPLTSTVSTAQSTATVQLPGGTAYEVVGVDLQLPGTPLAIEASATLAVVADGQRLPAPGQAGAWSVVPPGPGVEPPVVDGAPDGGWRVELSPGNPFGDEVGVLVSLRTQEVGQAPVPMAMSSGFADANGLAVGSPVDIGVYGSVVATEVVAVVDTVPGTLDPEAVLLDSGAVSTALLAQGRVLPDPTEIWATGTDPRVIAEQVAAAEGVASVVGPDAVSVTDAAAAVRLVFWVAAAGAVLLAVTGVAAVAATVAATRRPEVAVLRALGMTAQAQARARVVEVGGVVLAAVVLGLGVSWLVGTAVVPDLAMSTTAQGQATLPTRTLLELDLWLLALGLGAVTVTVVLGLLAARVQTQALDRGYREEIR